jgi:alpha-N-acetylglucosamine transferase
MYSENDTPKSWVSIMKQYFTKVIGFDDNNITLNPKGIFTSHYSHFNTLRTCNYLFSYNLINYEKICIVESDMVLMSSIDDVFKLKTPSVLFINLNKKNINENNITKYKITDCNKGSQINGGILLFKPSKLKFDYAIQTLEEIINKNCKYPNEELFLMVETKFNKYIYNLPIIYNYCHYNLIKKQNTKPIRIVHFNETKYKYLDIIKSGFVNKFPEKIKIVEYFRNEYYNKLYKIIDEILLELNNNNNNIII